VLTLSSASYRAIAFISASTQKSGVIVFETRNDTALLLARSRMRRRKKSLRRSHRLRLRAHYLICVHVITRRELRYRLLVFQGYQSSLRIDGR
jgi:hypothetical protein